NRLRWGSFIAFRPYRAVGSFDHLVGLREQRRRDVEAKHPGSLGVDDQLELGRLHDRQVRRLRALQDAAGIDADLTQRSCEVAAVAYQPAGFGIFTQRVYRRDRIMRRQVCKLHAPGEEKWIGAYEESVGPVAQKSGESRVDLPIRTGAEHLN